MIPISVKTESGERGGGGWQENTNIMILYYEPSNVIFNKQTEENRNIMILYYDSIL